MRIDVSNVKHPSHELHELHEPVHENAHEFLVIIIVPVMKTSFPPFNSEIDVLLSLSDFNPLFFMINNFKN